MRNFFESSHRKGPQDAAGGLLKKPGGYGVVRGKAEIQCARNLYNFAEAKLKTTVLTIVNEEFLNTLRKLNAITNHFSQSDESGRFIESRHWIQSGY